MAIFTRDGNSIYDKDWGSGTPIVFSHGWPLSSDARETQMVHLSSNGFRCTAHDRRGHGRSSQPFSETNLKKLNIPVPVLHGDDAQVVPIKATGMHSAALAPLKIYPGLAHALPDMARHQLNADLLAFARS